MYFGFYACYEFKSLKEMKLLPAFCSLIVDDYLFLFYLYHLNVEIWLKLFFWDRKKHAKLEKIELHMHKIPTEYIAKHVKKQNSML